MILGALRSAGNVSALLLLACAAAPPPERGMEHLAPWPVDGFAEVRGSAARRDVASLALWIEMPRISQAADCARAERWPLAEEPEAPLRVLARAWREELQRALFRGGARLAERSGPGVATIQLELERVAPTDRWLNAVGAELALEAPGEVRCTYALLDANGELVLFARSREHAHAARLVDPDSPWCAAAEAPLREGAARFATLLLAQPPAPSPPSTPPEPSKPQ